MSSLCSRFAISGSSRSTTSAGRSTWSFMATFTSILCLPLFSFLALLLLPLSLIDDQRPCYILGIAISSWVLVGKPGALGFFFCNLTVLLAPITLSTTRTADIPHIESNLLCLLIGSSFSLPIDPPVTPISSVFSSWPLMVSSSQSL